MNVRPSVLCPVDYSPASAAALGCAAALADQFVTRLIVMSVRNGLAADGATDWAAFRQAEESALATFVRATFGPNSAIEALGEYEMAVGTAATEIARIARERSCDLIVMAQPCPDESSRNQSAATLEALLAGTAIPVLLTPPYGSARNRVDDFRQIVRRVVVAVDPTMDGRHQRDVAIALAEALGVDLASDAVPTADATRAARTADGSDTDATDLMVVSLSGGRDQALHSWTTIRSFTAPALILVLPPSSSRSDGIHAAIRAMAIASSVSGHRRTA